MERTIGLPGREPIAFAAGLAAFLASATLAGALMGGFVSVGGRLIWGAHNSTIILAAIAVLVTLDAFFGRVGAATGGARLRLRPPSLRRQVCALTIVRHSRWVTGGNWGFQLGAGVFTAVNSWAFWGMVVGFGAYGRPLLGVGAGAIYGGMRGLQPTFAPILARQGLSGGRLVARVDTALMVGPVAAVALIGSLAFGHVFQ